MTPWPRVPLGSIADIAAGDSAPQGVDAFTPDGKPFVRMQDVGRYGRTDNLTETTDRVSESVSARLKVFPKGSILIPKSGASIRLNHRAILGVDAHVVSHLAIVMPCSAVNGHFLYYWLSCIDMAKVAPESNYPSLRLPDLAQVPVPLPPLPDQERVVRVLDEAEALRRIRAQADQRMRGIVTSFFHEMLGDPSLNPKAWPVRPAGDLMTLCEYGTSQKASDLGQGVPVLRMNNVTADGLLDLSDLKTVELSEDELGKYRLAVGDVLFNRTNSRELVGKTGMWDGRFEAVAASYFIRVRFDPALEHPQHFTIFMNLPLMKRRLMEMARGAIGQANINAQELKAIQLPVPPIDLQCQFAVRVAEIRELEAAQATSRKRLDDLFQSFLNRAFEGEL